MKTSYLILAGLLILYLLIEEPIGSMSIPGYREKMAKAIMEFEGYFQGSVSQRNNNPGNLKYAGQANVVGTDNQGHAIFDTFENGWRALLRQIDLMFTTSSLYNPDMTLYQVFNRYAEANGNRYAEYVANKLGVSPSTRLRELI